MANCSLLNNEWKCSIIQSDYIQGTSLMQFRTILTTAALLEYYRDTLRSECKRDLVVSLFESTLNLFTFTSHICSSTTYACICSSLTGST